MGNLARLIADEEQQRGDGVRNRRARASQHAMPADVRALDDEHFAEERGVRRLDLDKQHTRVREEVMKLLASRSLRAYSSATPVSGRLAMMRIGHVRRLAEKRSAIASRCTPWTRSSVERSTREMSEVTMIVTMNHVAICTPSGRSKTLMIVVYTKMSVMAAKAIHSAGRRAGARGSRRAPPTS